MLTVAEAARRAGRDPETIRRWIRSGRLRASKVGTLDARLRRATDKLGFVISPTEL